MSHKSIAVGAAVALAGAVALRRFGVEPVPTVFYLLAWYPTLLLLDALVAWKGGPSLWDQPRDTAAMLGWSVVIWCGFETLNFRLRDWYYVFAPASLWQRWAGVSISFATVIPAILLPERLLDRLGVARGLVAGVLWEAYNALSRAKWIYTVPFLEQLKIFEMPPLGFVGFAFFALEAWSLYHLCRAWRSAWRAAFALGFVVLAHLGLDRWTVSSTLPYVDDLPGVSATARTRLERGGLHDVFRLAALAPDSVAARSGLPPGEAQAVVTAARLVTLRGIGTRHAARLQAAGVTSVARLARADPDSLWRALPHDPHPTPAAVRVRVRAARRALGSRW